MSCPSGYKVKSFLGFNKKCVLCQPTDSCYVREVYSNSAPELPYTRETSTTQTNTDNYEEDEDILDQIIAEGDEDETGGTPSPNRGGKLLDGILEKVPNWLDNLVGTGIGKIGGGSSRDDYGAYDYDYDDDSKKPATPEKSNKTILFVGGGVALLILLLLIFGKKGKK